MAVATVGRVSDMQASNREESWSDQSQSAIPRIGPSRDRGLEKTPAVVRNLQLHNYLTLYFRQDPKNLAL